MSEGKVLCPYCGGEMKVSATIDSFDGKFVAWYWCKCTAHSPQIRSDSPSFSATEARKAALRRYQPENRVLTLEEVKAQVPAPLWIEIRDKRHGSQLVPKAIEEVEVVVTQIDGGQFLWTDDYGRVWRCWLRKPAEEERKAVEWDG